MIKDKSIRGRLSKIPVYARLNSLVHRRRAKKLHMSLEAVSDAISREQATVSTPDTAPKSDADCASHTAQLRADVQSHLDSMAPSAPKLDLAMMLRVRSRLRGTVGLCAFLEVELTLSIQVLNMSLMHATDALRGAEQARLAYHEASTAWQLCNHGVNAQMNILQRALERLKKKPGSPTGASRQG
jgi:hypothetical protein